MSTVPFSRFLERAIERSGGRVVQSGGDESRMRVARLEIKGLLRHFISARQLQAIVSNCRGEEKDFFFDKLAEIHRLISDMPATYEQDGKGDQAIAYLHYFTGGCDWYITEKDKGCAKDGEWSVDLGDGRTRPVEKGEQWQAFGLANLGYGGELGYISIQELIENNVELDLYFKPIPLATVKRR